MNEVLDRMLELTFESKIRFDSDQYERTTSYIDMMREIDKELPSGSKIRFLPAYKKLMSYKKIDKFTVIENNSEEPLLGGADFTEKTITRRIEQGYKDGRASLA